MIQKLVNHNRTAQFSFTREKKVKIEENPEK